MTPRSAATAAARRAAPRRRPARGRARPIAAPPAAPRVVPRAPRRVSGPAPPRVTRRGRATLGARALAGLRALPDRGIVVRLVRGRLWIGLIACLLLGLVTMQVSLLKLNASIGRAVQQGANLDRRNGELRAEVSRLGTEARIQAMGARLGLVMPEAGRVTYLSTRPGQDAAAATQALRSNKLGRGGAAPAQAPQGQATQGQATQGPSAPGDPSAAQADPSAGQGAPSASPDPGTAGAQATVDPAASPSATGTAGAAPGGTGAQG